MTEEQKTALDSVLAVEGVTAQAEAFAALPRPIRKAIFFQLPSAELRKAARAIVEARRGVSRTETGDIVLSDEALVAKRDRLAAKIKETEESRLPAWKQLLADTDAAISQRGIGNNEA
jgi:hypothetical protein